MSWKQLVVMAALAASPCFFCPPSWWRPWWYRWIDWSGVRFIGARRRAIAWRR